MSRVIPKESLTAYQRWELGAVDVPQARNAQETGPAGEELPTLAVTLPTTEELERLHQTAWEEGYALGMEQGRQAGLAQGESESKEALRRMSELIDAMETEQLGQDEQLSREVLDLALVVAQRMIRTALFIKE
jgi:flagellar assembly protein FliH